MQTNPEIDEKIKVIVITGATASGKTDLSFKLAEQVDIEIISADSRQIYKYLNIGTAKPTQNELSTVKHHFVDFLEPTQNYSAGEFGNQAYKVLLDIAARGKIPVVVGGSGLYLKGLCEGLFEENSETSMLIRNNLEQKLKEYGIDTLYDELQKIDKPLYDFYIDKNPRRILRALEYYYSTGTRLSDARKIKPNREKIQPYYFASRINRDILYARINERVEKMWEIGLAKETEEILKMGFSETLNSLNTVGYKETIAYIKGELPEVQAKEEIKKNTRHYAKRQITWFKKNSELNFIENEFDILAKIVI